MYASVCAVVISHSPSHKKYNGVIEWNKSHLNPDFSQNHEYTGSTLEYFQRFFE